MNDEVKLILTKLKIVSEEKENGCYICDREHSKLLLSYIEQLENNRDKAIEFGNGLLLGEATFEERHIANKFLKILKGDSDE